MMIMDCQPSLFAWGDSSIAWIAQHLRYAWLTPLMLFFSEIAQVGPILFTTAFSYWIWNKRYGRVLCYGLFANLFVNIWVKGLVKECRPPTQFWLENVANSYSFPSGHSQIGVYLWFGLAFYLNKKWQSLLCLLIGLFIALSRPYLGVHYPQDIVVGSLLGIAILSITILFEKKNIILLGNYPTWARAFVLLICLLIFQYYINDPRNAEVANIGATLGFWLGCQLEEKFLKFKPPVTLGPFLWQITIGIAGILLFWKGGDWLRQQLSDAAAINATYLHYFLLGMWIAYGAPALRRGQPS